MKVYVCGACGYEYDPKVGDQIMESNREQHLRICRKIGYALSAHLEKKSLKKKAE